MSEEFRKGQRGAIVKSNPNKVRITIRLDSDLVEHYKEQVRGAGGGNYQTLINDALREHLQRKSVPLEETLRKVIREELRKTG